MRQPKPGKVEFPGQMPLREEPFRQTLRLAPKHSVLDQLGNMFAYHPFSQARNDWLRLPFRRNASNITAVISALFETNGNISGSHSFGRGCDPDFNLPILMQHFRLQFVSSAILFHDFKFSRFEMTFSRLHSFSSFQQKNTAPA